MSSLSINVKKRAATDDAARQNPNELSLKRQRTQPTPGSFNDVTAIQTRPTTVLKSEESALLLYPSKDKFFPFMRPEDGKPVWTNEENRFPRFKDGGVFIELVDGSKEFSYAFSRNTLERSSTWFAKELQRTVSEKCQRNANEFKLQTLYSHRLELHFNEDDKIWALKRVAFTFKKKLNKQVPHEVCETYNNLFLLMNGLRPSLHDFNFDTVLNQIEQIIKLATYYCCLNLVRRSYLTDHLTALFKHDLYKAIMLDAPRYLKLSIYLESDIIFREAMIHAVGQFLDYPWKTYPAPELPDHIFQLIASKQEEIRSLKASVDAKLFIDSVFTHGRFLTFTEVSLQTWIVVHHWRDWVSSAMKQINDSYPGSFTNGVVYRLLKKGGDAYLSTASVYEHMKILQHGAVRGWGMEEVEKDLNIMKNLGRVAVDELCVNNSRLDVEQFGIEYLTCCTITRDELPWYENGELKLTDEKWPVRGLRPPTQ